MVFLKRIRLVYGLMFGLIGFVLLSCEQEKTAYVDNTELIQSYDKMIQAKKEFESRNKDLQEEFDSLARDFQNQLKAYEENIKKMNTDERNKEENRLIALRQKIEDDGRQRSLKIEQESDSVADELVKEVKKKVELYGEENGYTYIFGSNDTANILYAKKGKDITLEMIEYINK